MAPIPVPESSKSSRKPPLKVVLGLACPRLWDEKMQARGVHKNMPDPKDKGKEPIKSSSLYKVRNEVTNSISYQWNKEAETSFQRWKNCMETLPTVVPPTRGEVLFLHIAASPDETGAMLFAEQKRIQIPIYFVSRTLPDVEQSYAASEKLILALIHATRHLRRYFKDHPIRVLTDKPFERAFLSLDGTRRMVKWAKELEEYDIEYGENDPFEGQIHEPAETCESSVSSNKKVFQAKRKEKHHIGDLKTRLVQHNQKKEECLESGAEQQASSK
ncbi:reverse transcriptase domain-containing protein [Artemisia annua]|uniref:Reverse transcriptase domain-containing protein n=1 Tax=Artemisia annua TaxID=35608 RepID=A0A2U1LGH5_ARTAN|nr:reverse transcriptase domain-containing protein [Artemisia annua]